MTRPERRTVDPHRNFVVVTQIKPDGRKIHYYEWPDPPPEPGVSKTDKAAAAERRRV